MNTTKKLALTGIMTAFCLLILLAASVIPNSKIILFGLATLPISVLVMECDKKYALLHYIATSCLALILLPNKYAVLPYVVVLGLYGLVKSIAEKNNKTVIEWLVKLIYFNATLGLYLVLIFKVFFININFPIPIWVLVLGCNVLFIIYDVIYSFCVSYYEKSIRPKIKAFSVSR